jgi:hypothetical protein
VPIVQIVLLNVAQVAQVEALGPHKAADAAEMVDGFFGEIATDVGGRSRRAVDRL